METTTSFGVWNYVVLAIVLIISAAIGLYYRFTGGKQKTAHEYLFADGNMSYIPVAFSLMASFMSAISILGASKEVYSFGTEFILINFGYLLGTPIVAYGFLPVFFKMRNTSVYEYLKIRFGVIAQVAASISFSIQMILYMGIVLYSPALTLSIVTGLSKLGAILSVGIVCCFYSTLGGMKAVLITDVFQVLIMFASVYCVIIKGTMDAGGFENVWHIAKTGGRLELFDFNPNPLVRHTFWTLIIGGLFTCVSLYGVNQTQVQRSLAVKNLKKSQNAMWLNWPIMTFLSISASYTGLVVYARYFDCDPLEEGRITAMDQILPIFVMDSMGHIPGLLGLFVAGIFSGSLSTVSSAINSLAAVTIEDYIKPLMTYLKRDPLSNKKSMMTVKLLAMFYGILCIGIALLTEHLGGVLQAALTIFGVVGGPLLGLFTLGLFFWIANEIGAVTGLAFGLAISFWIGFGGPKPPLPYLPVSTEGCEPTDEPIYVVNSTVTNMLISTRSHEDEHYFLLYRISYLYTVVIGFFITLLVGLLLSVIYQKIRPSPQQPIDPDLYSPFIRRFIPDNRKKTSNIEAVPSSSVEPKEVEKY